MTTLALQGDFQKVKDILKQVFSQNSKDQPKNTGDLSEIVVSTVLTTLEKQFEGGYFSSIRSNQGGLKDTIVAAMDEQKNEIERVLRERDTEGIPYLCKKIVRRVISVLRPYTYKRRNSIA